MIVLELQVAGTLQALETKLVGTLLGETEEA